MAFAAVTTAAASLFLLGGLGYVYFRINNFTTNVSGKFEMNVYTKIDLPRTQALATADKIRALAGVKTVTLMPKEQAWKEWQSKLGVSGEGLDNPLPDTLHVTLTDPKMADGLANQIQLMPEVYQPHGIEYSKDAQRILDLMMVVVKWLGGALGALLFATSGILIYNAIRLTVIARRREIRIMQLVGASYFTIWTPFVIEGIIQGVIGGIIAAFLLYAAQVAFQGFINGVTDQISVPVFPLGPVVILLTAAGAAYGFVCSSFAVREPLRQGAGFQR
jgi:cell division transport system permease protein